MGVFGSDSEGVRIVSGGAIDLSFAYLGSGGGDAPQPGPTATADYVPVPGTEPGGDLPTLSPGSRGVYEAEDVIFGSPRCMAGHGFR